MCVSYPSWYIQMVIRDASQNNEDDHHKMAYDVLMTWKALSSEVYH